MIKATENYGTKPNPRGFNMQNVTSRTTHLQDDAKFKEAGEIRQQISMLEKRQTELLSEIENLNNKLEPVMASVPNADAEKGGDVAGMNTEIGERLRMLNDRTETVIYLVRSISRRLSI